MRAYGQTDGRTRPPQGEDRGPGTGTHAWDRFSGKAQGEESGTLHNRERLQGRKL